MKNIHEVIRAKEDEIMRVKTEVEALRLAAPLLDADDDGHPPSNGKAVAQGRSPTSGE